MLSQETIIVVLATWSVIASFVAWSMHEENKMLIEMNDDITGIIFSQIKDIREELDNDD